MKTTIPVCALIILCLNVFSQTRTMDARVTDLEAKLVKMENKINADKNELNSFKNQIEKFLSDHVTIGIGIGLRSVRKKDLENLQKAVISADSLLVIEDVEDERLFIDKKFRSFNFKIIFTI